MAPQNRDIKMRIFLDAAGAEKAYNALMRNIEAGQKRIAELKNAKKTNGRLTDSEAEELKNLQQDQKVWKSIVKETRGYYEDIASSIRNINALSIRELEGLIKNTKAQLASLVPGKDDADISRLSQALGIAQRELAVRNKQILQQSQRSFQAILNEINTSQEHLAAISTKGANAAAMRQQQEEMQKNLTRLETRRRNEEEKFAQHQQELANRQSAYNTATIGQKKEIIRAIQDQVEAEVRLEQFVKSKPRSAEARKTREEDKLAKEKDVEQAKKRMEVVLAANATEADSINGLMQIYRRYVEERERSVRQPNNDKWDASIVAQKQRVSDAAKAAAEAEKEYNDARMKAGTDKPYQQSIDALKRLYSELEAVRNKETEVAERMKMTDQLKEMDRTIQEMEGKRMSMQQARQIASSPYTAQIEQLKQARESWEAYRLTLSSTDINGLREVDAAIKNIDRATLLAKETASNWKQTIAEARQAMQQGRNPIDTTRQEANLKAADNAVQAETNNLKQKEIATQQRLNELEILQTAEQQAQAEYARTQKQLEDDLTKAKAQKTEADKLALANQKAYHAETEKIQQQVNAKDQERKNILDQIRAKEQEIANIKANPSNYATAANAAQQLLSNQQDVLVKLQESQNAAREKNDQTMVLMYQKRIDEMQRLIDKTREQIAAQQAAGGAQSEVNALLQQETAELNRLQSAHQVATSEYNALNKSIQDRNKVEQDLLKTDAAVVNATNQMAEAQRKLDEHKANKPADNSAAYDKERQQLLTNLDLQKQKVEAAKQAQQAAQQELASVIAANGMSLERMRAIYERVKQARDLAQTDTARNAMNEQMRQMEQRMQEMQTVMMSGRQVSQVYSQAIAEIGKGTAANSAKLRENIELMKVAQMSKDIDAQTYNRLSAAIKVSTDMLNKEGNSYMTTSQALQAYRQGMMLVREGENANVDSIRQVIDALTQAQSIEGISMRQKEIYAHMVQNLTEIEEGNVRMIFDEASAAEQYAKAQDMLRNSSHYTADELRRQHQIMQQATTARGLSLQTTQQCAAAEREFAEILKQSNTSTMIAAEAEIKIAEAKVMLENIYLEETSAIKAMVDQLKLAENAEGMLLSRSQEAVGIRKQMEQALNRSTGATMSYTQAQGVLTKGDAALVSEINAAIASLEAENNMWNTTAETKKRNLTLMEQLRAMTSVTRKEATALAYDQTAVNNALANLKTIPVDKLREAIQMLKDKLDKAKMSQQEFIEKSSQLNKLEARYKSLKGSVDGVIKSVQNQGTWFEKATTKLMNYLGIFGGFFLVRQKLQQAFQANLEYDDSLSNIRKTTGLTAESVKMLADNIKRIDTRTSLQDMNDLAYSAGKLGVKGVSDVMGFVRAAEHVKIALGEQLGDSSQAVEQLMKITSIMGVQQQYGLEESIERVGSSLNYLTMNSQATAQPMVDFMKRIAGVSTQAGVTASELAGLAGTVSALGQPVEMSATSISKMMVQISGHSQQVAKALQMTAEETQQFFYDIDTGQMTNALLTVLRKTNEAGGLSHLSTIVKDLGSNGQRVIQTIATLSENYSMVEKMVRMSNEAFDQGTSVINEYNLKQENTAALWERMKNNFSKMFVSTDAVAYIKEILISLGNLPKAIRTLAGHLSWIMDVLKELIEVVSHLTFFFSALFEAMLLRSAISALAKGMIWITSIFSTLGNIIQVGVITKFRKAKAEAGGFFNLLRTASFGNVFIALATVLLTVINLMSEAYGKVKQWKEESIELLERTKEQSQETTTSINAMLSRLKAAADGTEERKRIIDELNRSYGTFLSQQIKEGENYQTIYDKLKQVNEELKLKAYLEGRQQMVNDIESSHREERGSARADLVKNIAAYIGGDKTAANAVASNIASRLLEQQEDGTRFGASLLNAFYDSDGNITGYQRKAQPNGNTDKEVYNVQKTLQELVEGVVADYNKDNGTKLYVDKTKWSWADFGQRSLERQITGDLVDYLAIDVKQEEEIREKAKGWDADIADQSNKVKKRLVEEVKGLWSAVEKAVTQEGAYATTEVQNDQMQYWRDRKKTLQADRNGKGRVEEEDRVKAYLNRVDDLMRQMEGEGKRYRAGITQAERTEANETEEYKLLRTRQFNAEQYLRVLEVGRIEDPEKNKDGKTRRDAKSEYDDIIKKIEAFFKTRAEQISFDRENGKMTQYEFERQTKENEKFLNDALAIARDGISRDNDALNDFVKAWEDEKKLLESLIRSGQTEHDARYYMDLINNTGPLRNIGIAAVKGENDAGNDGTAWLHGVMSQAESNRLNSLKIQNEWNKQMLKAQLEHSPVGKITEQYLVEFQQLGLMFERLEAENSDELRRKEQQVMASYLKIGKETSKYDITTREGLDKFRAFVGSQHKIVNDANAVTDEMLRSFYYQSYQYAEQYGEAVSKLIEKNRKAWERMFKQSARYTSLQDAEAEARNALKSSASQVQGRRGMFGVFGKRTSLEDERQAAQQNFDRLSSQLGINHSEEYQSLVNQAQKRLERINKKIQKATESYENAIEEIKELEEMGEKEYNRQHARDGLTYNLRMAQLRKTVAAAERKLRNDTVKTQLTLGAQQMERYGGSNRYTLQKQVDQKRAELNTRVGVWDNDIAKAEAMQRAQQYNYNAVAQEYGADSDEARKAFGDLEQANVQLEAMQQMPDEVRTAIEGLTDAMVNLQDATYAWAGEMVSAFEKVADAFVPLRSWYDDKGSFAQNVFGTKAERQKAFGDFMDDMKKTTRKAVQEHMRLKTQEYIIDKFNERRKLAEEAKAFLLREGLETEGLSKFKLIKTAEEIWTKKTEAEKNAATAAGTGFRTGENIKESTTGMWGNFGKAITAAWADGGPFLGAVLAAGVSAALGAVMTMVFNMLGSSKASTSAPKTKLVSGMLTYDNGNVQSVFDGGAGVVRTYDRGRQPVMGDDGKLYWVEDRDYGVSPKTGLLTRPTLTSIGGQPALVAENGPEMVIGRATTHALALNEPEVLRTIIRYDRNHSRGFAKTFDAGTAGSLAAGTPSSSGSSAFDAEVSSAQSAALADTLTALSQTLAAIQQKGIPANLNMYGAGGALEKFAEAMYKTQRRGSDPNLNRLFRR